MPVRTQTLSVVPCRFFPSGKDCTSQLPQ